MSKIENCSVTDNMANKAIRDQHRDLFFRLVRETGSTQSVIDRMLQEIVEVCEQRDDLFSKGHKLAFVLECILLATDSDMAAISKYWDEAHQALEEWRK